jgi:hypothetical protein
VKALFPYSQLVDAVLEQAMAGRPDGHALGADFFDMLLQKVNSGVPLNRTDYFWEYYIARFSIPQARADREEPRRDCFCHQLAECATAIDQFSA